MSDQTKQDEAYPQALYEKALNLRLIVNLAIDAICRSRPARAQLLSARKTIDEMLDEMSKEDDDACPATT